MQLDAAAIAQTFHLLASYNGIVRWGAIKGKEIEGSWAGNAAELVQFAEAYADWNFYVQLNPSGRRSGKRCKAEDIEAWEWFPIDLDPTVKDIERDELYGAMNEVMQAMQAYLGAEYEPHIIDSGRGMQLWYRVANREGGWPFYEVQSREPRRFPIMLANLAEGDVEKVRDIPMADAVTCAQRYWLERLSSRVTSENVVVDPSVSDLPRLMRCPGTVNLKTGERAYIFQPGGAVQRGLGAKLLRYTPSERMIPSMATDDYPLVAEGTPWQAALSKVNPTAANFVTHGAAEPGRHRACSGAARSLAEVGLSELEVLRAITHGGARSRPELLDPEYLERTARDAIVRAGRIPLDNAAQS